MVWSSMGRTHDKQPAIRSMAHRRDKRTTSNRQQQDGLVRAPQYSPLITYSIFINTNNAPPRSQYYAVPSPYEGAEYTLLKGTTTNATHWQVTARCRGCTSWSSADGDFNLHNDDQAILAYACSSVTPDEKTSNTSTFNIHEQFGIWSHELSFAKNESFGDWVKANEVQEEGEVVERRWYA